MANRFRVLGCFLLAALLGGGPALAVDPKDREELLAFGAEAPDIAGPVLNGAPGTHLAQFRGKVVAVDFWATWCTPCLLSMPELNRLRTQMRALGYGDRFEIVGVNVDGDPELARRFLKAHPVDYPIISDPIGIAMKRFGPWKLPATFLLTPDGRVHMIWLGYADYFADDIKSRAVDLLHRTAPAPAAAQSPVAAAAP